MKIFRQFLTYITLILVSHQIVSAEQTPECGNILGHFRINFYENNNGIPGTKISNNSIVVGETFFLEITAEDTRGNGNSPGFHGISLDVRWNPSDIAFLGNFGAAEIVSDSLPLFSFGELQASLGRINDLSGSAALGLGVGALVGGHGPERFSIFPVIALKPIANTQITLRGGKYDIAFFPPIHDQPCHFNFETASLTILENTVSNWTNPNNKFDVNDDGSISAIDVLTLLNALNENSVGTLLPFRSAPTAPYFDVNGDGHLTPLDALQTINYLESGLTAEGEASFVNSTADDAVKLDQQLRLTASDSLKQKNYRYSDRFNTRKAKFIQGKDGWYYILRSGKLYHWNKSFAKSRLLGILDSSYHKYPEKLYKAYL